MRWAPVFFSLGFVFLQPAVVHADPPISPDDPLVQDLRRFADRSGIRAGDLLQMRFDEVASLLSVPARDLASALEVPWERVRERTLMQAAMDPEIQNHFTDFETADVERVSGKVERVLMEAHERHWAVGVSAFGHSGAGGGASVSGETVLEVPMGLLLMAALGGEPLEKSRAVGDLRARLEASAELGGGSGGVNGGFMLYPMLVKPYALGEGEHQLDLGAGLHSDFEGIGGGPRNGSIEVAGDVRLRLYRNLILLRARLGLGGVAPGDMGFGFDSEIEAEVDITRAIEGEDCGAAGTPYDHLTVGAQHRVLWDVIDSEAMHIFSGTVNVPIRNGWYVGSEGRYNSASGDVPAGGGGFLNFGFSGDIDTWAAEKIRSRSR